MDSDQLKINACKNQLPKGAEIIYEGGYFIINYKGKRKNSSRSELTALRTFLKNSTEVFNFSQK